MSLSTCPIKVSQINVCSALGTKWKWLVPINVVLILWSGFRCRKWCQSSERFKKFSKQCLWIPASGGSEPEQRKKTASLSSGLSPGYHLTRQRISTQPPRPPIAFRQGRLDIFVQEFPVMVQIFISESLLDAIGKLLAFVSPPVNGSNSEKRKILGNEGSEVWKRCVPFVKAFSLHDWRVFFLFFFKLSPICANKMTVFKATD